MLAGEKKMSTERDFLATRIILNAILPVMKTVIADDKKMGKRFEGVTGKVLFVGDYNGEDVGATLVFRDGSLEIEQAITPNPDVEFRFKTIEQMNAFLGGKTVLPKIKGFRRVGLLVKVVTLLLSIKILLPTSRPKKDDLKRLKVKLVIYMITTALSQYNKGGDQEMVAWTKKQPDRVYQMSVDSDKDLAAYVRIKAGKSKAGRGFYKRRRPFVHMRFKDVDSAIAVFLKDVEFVEAVASGRISVVGSPEYAANMNDFMQRIQGLVA